MNKMITRMNLKKMIMNNAQNNKIKNKKHIKMIMKNNMIKIFLMKIYQIMIK